MYEGSQESSLSILPMKLESRKVVSNQRASLLSLIADPILDRLYRIEWSDVKGWILFYGMLFVGCYYGWQVLRAWIF